MTNPKSRLSMTNPWHLLATGFGSGLSPVVPGTMGTLASVPFYLLLAQLPLTLYIVVVIAASLIGIKICQVTSDDMQVHDHGSIVWDEFAGFWITMLIVPVLQLPVFEWKWLLAGFVLFRFFDMVKPWPIGWLDKRVHGGLGIMLDDLVAGVMSALALALVGYWAGWLS
ncbi:phosphatidylglycerophosphatase A [Vibrio fluvialis]|jgi:phosphatidylglycerophosphatase A|uniref:phosphatidylglycerophosphatase A n=1 Tax=Vibrio fluvialis TaxID=676 RepID=UPI000645D55F|nr:phosphatidylglycerophosphatase A [Vibrio fluvialis]EKO3382795.1 phosphatidylglycerophosphatase A [Vibrio fluvialis]EKO3392075.1 phosphatidylglycerophosphatase A [Vibrio fluvialis]EKO3395556.1 phosphatidylglycerophosphatase A [Vibrio fluvialis]EKO3397076.1 phosphatidylglycerophosphatase A [Vibrio fluvialis]EKO3469553.1 phosphatidylglycerophosphatase A [Vibrio fluvialis]